MMKRTVIFLVLIAAAFVSCRKTGVDLCKGYYSFKTGGYLEITGKLYDIGKDTTRIDTLAVDCDIIGAILGDTLFRYTVVPDTLSCRDTIFTRYLLPESGQMHILPAGGDEVKVTMNVTGGSPAVFDGKVGGEYVTLMPLKRQVGIIPDGREDGQSVFVLLTVSGEGRKYDNMLLFDLDYSGTYEYDGMSGEISGTFVDCIATENE